MDRKLTALFCVSLMTLGVLALLSVHQVAADPFGDNKRITTNPKPQDKAAIAVDGTGSGAYIYMVWRDQQDDASGSTANIYFCRSDNGGLVWGAVTRLDDAPGATDGWKDNPDIAVGADGRVYVVYDDMRSSQSQVMLQVSTDHGLTWGAHVHVGADDREEDPAITVLGSGITAQVYVAYKGKSTEGIIGVYSSDGGATFGAETMIVAGGVPNDEQTMKTPDLATDGTYVYCVWSQPKGYGNQDNIYCSRSSVGGLTWGAPVPVTSLNSATQKDPCVACGGSEVHVAWTDFQNDDNGVEDMFESAADNSDIYYTSSSNSGTSFSGASMINDDIATANQYFPSIVVDSSGYAVVAWQDYRNGNTDPDIYYSSQGATGFSSNNRANGFTNPSAKQTNPAISIETGNTVWCAWTDDRNGNEDIYAAHTITNTAPTKPVLKTVNSYSPTHVDIPYYINLESDFQKYVLHMDTATGFTPDGTNIVNQTTDQSTEILGAWGLTPGTMYYFRLVVYDNDGLSSTSDELGQATPAVNTPPVMTKMIPNGTLSIDEDSSARLLNLSEYFVDDHFKGGTLSFGVSRIDAGHISTEIVNETWVLFTANQKNWVGTALFHATCTDGGMDGIHNMDDLTVTSNNFTVQINPINDPPSLTKLYPPASSAISIIHSRTYTIQSEADMANEDTEYSFKIEAFDVDEDDIVFACNDTRVMIAADPDAPTTRKIFTFTPDNEDSKIGWMYFNISASDQHDSEWIDLAIKVRGMNDPPVWSHFIKDDARVEMSPIPSWTLTEREWLNFTVYATDPDGPDKLFFGYRMPISLDSGDPVTVLAGPTPHSCNISVYGSPELVISVPGNSFDLTLTVSDSSSTDQETTVTIQVVNINDDPVATKIEYTSTMDKTPYEEKAKKDDANINDNEPLMFTGYGSDPDSDALTYSWDFGDRTPEVTGKVVYHTYNTNMTYNVTLTITDGHGGSAALTIPVIVTSDNDRDNDSLPDDWEMKWWKNMDQGGQDDPDKDGVPNYNEWDLGTNPTKAPGTEVVDGDGDGPVGGNALVAGIVIGSIVLFFVLVIVGFIIFLHIQSNRKADAEDKEMEKIVKDQEDRQAQLNNLYGVQVAGASVESGKPNSAGADMSALSDAEKIFMGASPPTGEGGPSIVPAGDNVPGGPVLATGSGPVFDESAPKLELKGETIELEAVPEEEDSLEIISVGQPEILSKEDAPIKQ